MVGEVERDMVVLRDGVFVHEAGDICRELEQAGVPFVVSQVSKEGAGIVESHRNNWSTALGTVMNYFNQGGLGVYLRILVSPADLDRANAALAPKPRAKRRINFVFWGIVIIIAFIYLYVRDVQIRERLRPCGDQPRDLSLRILGNPGDRPQGEL